MQYLLGYWLNYLKRNRPANFIAGRFLFITSGHEALSGTQREIKYKAGTIGGNSIDAYHSAFRSSNGCIQIVNAIYGAGIYTGNNGAAGYASLVKKSAFYQVGYNYPRPNSVTLFYFVGYRRKSST